ncbi:MAG: DUF4185 domain-containing protein, partial [Myxococcales bacterium]|nr:DUF4185 domain-containing protein [Myxococcales bacterium]
MEARVLGGGRRAEWAVAPAKTVRAALFALGSLVVGCADETLPVTAVAYADADALFHQDEHWLGSDGAFSIPLDGERTLWLFGDTFVATSDELDRTESRMVRNSVAIQVGSDPLTAEWSPRWRAGGEGPESFFAEEGSAWYWPSHGIRLAEGPLLIFMSRQLPAESGLGFAAAGTRVAFVENPDDEPVDWQVDFVDPTPPAADPSATIGMAVLRRDDDVFAFTGALGDRHVGWLARFHVAHLLAGNVEPEWLYEGDFVPGWRLSDAVPDTVIDDIAPECSVHFEPRWNRFVHVASTGFGSTDIAIRTSLAPEGPWSDAVSVFTPPESLGSDPFVYAAKAHPELRGSSDRALLVTYATNSFD